MFSKIGGLKKYWHVIGLSNELKNSKSFKRKIYGIPLIIWRDNIGKISALLDVCPHKKAPLNVSNFKENKVTCSYHGWKFSKNGKILDIPSSPHLVKKLKCKCSKIIIKEQEGFLWGYLDIEKPNKSPENIGNITNKKWKNYYNSMIFGTTEELLIENFMDSTHTPIVHNKIVRSDKIRTEHSISVIQNLNSLVVKFKDREENVLFGLNSFLKKKLIISHKDEFILPNLVKINYKVNNINRFQAFVACTPISNGKTIAFLKISYNFGFLNFFLKPLIPIIAKKVLKQDLDISESQFKNIQIFKNLNESNIDYDLIHNKVKIIRNNIIKGKKNNVKSIKNIKLKV